MAKAWDIVSYTYRAEQLCPTCVIEAMIRQGEASPGARDMNEEAALDQIAEANGIDRMNEYSFDSGDFPKVVFSSMVDAERCDDCRKGL